MSSWAIDPLSSRNTYKASDMPPQYARLTPPFALRLLWWLVGARADGSLTTGRDIGPGVRRMRLERWTLRRWTFASIKDEWRDGVRIIGLET